MKSRIGPAYFIKVKSQGQKSLILRHRQHLTVHSSVSPRFSLSRKIFRGRFAKTCDIDVSKVLPARIISNAYFGVRRPHF